MSKKHLWMQGPTRASDSMPKGKVEERAILANSGSSTKCVYISREISKTLAIEQRIEIFKFEHAKNRKKVLERQTARANALEAMIVRKREELEMRDVRIKELEAENEDLRGLEGSKRDKQGIDWSPYKWLE
ncbi:uncharacterized protein KY384_006345 [Bacidia gigantensis]|uniref:uncharacterized protein n=1 Tax=Bacidia gigantensis TaxID=2732470 RepID=UPI001D0475EA|nr:uncharacterized protein KY384_006345 [Bacidia gigantensis]KAG8528658.1 hypothetical protein KY384_006345 [Bacidia gigantensis]